MHLAVHALSRGYEAITWVCNVRHIDPTWFQQPTDLRAKIRARFEAKNLVNDPRYGPALEAVERYLDLGGQYQWGDLTPELIAKTLDDGMPLLTGTNGTYLYQCARETEAGPDDVRGDAFGHFIVLSGYRSSDQSVAIADPLLDNPAHGTKYYRAHCPSLDRRHLSRRRLRRRQPARAPAEGLEEADRGEEVMSAARGRRDQLFLTCEHGGNRIPSEYAPPVPRSRRSARLASRLGPRRVDARAAVARASSAGRCTP